MDSYDLLRRRISTQGINPEARMGNDKLRTLKKALNYSYQSEVVVKDEVEYKALINNNKLKMDYDDKIISIPFDADFKIGDVFFWPRIKQHWIIYLREYSEDAYFRGFARRAAHTLRWENEFGKILETYGAVRGPVETKIKGEMKSGNAFDIPNYTLSVIVPYNEDTKTLKRYSKVAVNGKMWEVTVADDISEPGVIDLQLLEYYKHRDNDQKVLDTTILDEKEPDHDIEPLKSRELKNVEIKTSLDGVEELEIYEPFRLWTLVNREGVKSEELIKDAKFSVVAGNAIVTDSFLNVLEPPGMISIKLEIPKLGYEKIFTFEAKAMALPPARQWLIDGDESVRSYGKSEYHIRHYLDGVEDIVNNGEWVFTHNDRLFTVQSKSPQTIVLKWRMGVQGALELKYVANGQEVATKQIRVKSLI